MKLKLTKPSRRRANALGTTLGALGTAIGALPVTVRPGRSKVRSALRVAAPVGLVAAVVALVSRRRRRAADEAAWTATEVAPPPPAEPKTETAREKERETGEEEPGETIEIPTVSDAPSANGDDS